jgi:hypothetical protein
MKKFRILEHVNSCSPRFELQGKTIFGFWLSDYFQNDIVGYFDTLEEAEKHLEWNLKSKYTKIVKTNF